MPIKDLTPVAGWPVTYGSNGAPEGPSEQSELVVDALVRAGFVLCGRTNTPEFGVITVAENSRYGITRNPWDTDRSPRAARAAARPRRSPAGCSRSRTPTTAAARSASRPPTAVWSGLKPSRGRVPRLAQSWLGAVVEGVVARTRRRLRRGARCDLRAGSHSPGTTPRRPAVRSPQELDAAPGALRDRPDGRRRRSGIPTDAACIEAAARPRPSCSQALGHTVEEVEVPTISEEMVPPFIALTQGGLADYEGVDWSRGRAAHRSISVVRPASSGPTTTRSPPARSSCSAAASSRAGAVTSTCC